MIKAILSFLLGVIFAALKTAVIVYLILVGMMFFAQRALMFPAPDDTRTPEQAGVPQYILVESEADGRRLTNWYVAPSKAGFPVIAFFHGNAGSQAVVAPWLQSYVEAGYGVMVVAYRGYNGDKGEPSEEGLYADSRAALGVLKQMGFGPDRVVLLGQSLGTGVAVQMASEGLGSQLVLEAPYTSMVDEAFYHYPFVPASLLVRDPFDSLSKIAAVHMPVLMISGEQDAVVPHRLSQRLFAAANEPKQALWIPEAGHNDLYAHGAHLRILRFLEEGTPSAGEYPSRSQPESTGQPNPDEQR